MSLVDMQRSEGASATPDEAVWRRGRKTPRRRARTHTHTHTHTHRVQRTAHAAGEAEWRISLYAILALLLHSKV